MKEKIKELQTLSGRKKGNRMLTSEQAKNKTLHEFLYHHTPSYSTWIVCDCGYRVAIFYIDDEDLWSGWFPSQHQDCRIKSYTYDEATKTGRIEIE